MLFLFFSNVNVKFAKKELTWRTFSVNETLQTTKHIQFIDCKKFVAAALDPSEKAFVVLMAYLKAKMSLYPTWKAKIALLLAKKFTVPNKYLDFADIFSK